MDVQFLRQGTRTAIPDKTRHRKQLESMLKAITTWSMTEARMEILKIV